jgi:hypothetical protein
MKRQIETYINDFDIPKFIAILGLDLSIDFLTIPKSKVW